MQFGHFLSMQDTQLTARQKEQYLLCYSIWLWIFKNSK
ncbi:hypothetical protein PRUB_a3142 [Pseudoalteromonas rubra]|uniref:Uncharacterized protein n=1 Tax=Pseudoalteromonas rubra TaxID=43658 RepID=A0A8T0CCI7_9GAMM|nr:hypothetical protein PRUB_a3142 [Pseudoalteromonas rubra]